MKQPGKGCWKCYSLVTGGSGEGETDYNFIKAPLTELGCMVWGWKCPQDRVKSEKQADCYLEKRLITSRTSLIQKNDRRKDNSCFIPTSMSQLVTTQQLREIILQHDKFEGKKDNFHNTSRGDGGTNWPPRHRLQIRWHQNISRSCTWINGHHCAQKYSGNQTTVFQQNTERVFQVMNNIKTHFNEKILCTLKCFSFSWEQPMPIPSPNSFQRMWSKSDSKMEAKKVLFKYTTN